MSFVDIWNAINTEMLKVKNTDARVGSVYNYDIKIESWINLPAIIITPSSWDEWIFDSCKNDVTFNYIVRVIDSLQTNWATVEDNMRYIADIVMERLKDMPNIVYSNGETYKIEFTYDWWYIETQEPMRVFEINCKFSAIESK